MLPLLHVLQVNSLPRLIPDKAHLSSDDPYIPGEFRGCMDVGSIESPIFSPHCGIHVGVDPGL